MHSNDNTLTKNAIIYKKVKVVAWVFIISAIIMISLGLHQLIYYVENNSFPLSYGFGSGIVGAIIESLLLIFGMISMILLPITIFVFFSGIQLLRLRNWARASLAIVTWVHLSVTILGFIFWTTYVIMQSSSEPNRIVNRSDQSMIAAFSITIGVAFLIINVVIDYLLLKVLRSQDLKTAMLVEMKTD